MLIIVYMSLDIKKYNLNELLQFANIYNRAFNKLKRSEIVRGIDARIIRAQQLNKPKYKKFFITVKEYLLSLWEMLNEVGDEKKLSAFDNWDKAYNQKIIPEVKAKTRGKSGKLIGGDKIVVQQGNLPNSENYSRLGLTRGTLNPIFRQDIVKTCIIIKSKNRKIHRQPDLRQYLQNSDNTQDGGGCATLIEVFAIPGNAADSMYKEDGSHFTCTLSSTIKKCIQLEMKQVEIPISWYVFRAKSGTSSFWAGPSTTLGELYYPIDAAASYTKRVLIGDGNYTEGALIDILQSAITSAGLPYTVWLNIYTKRVTIANPEGKNFNLFFYLGPTEAVPANASKNTPYIPPITNKTLDPNAEVCVITELPRIDYNLGYLLGFRKERYTGSTSYTSEGIIDVYGPKTITLNVDTFTKNEAVSHVVHIKEDNEKFGRPKGIEDCKKAIAIVKNAAMADGLAFGLCREPRNAVHPDITDDGNLVQALNAKKYWAKQQRQRLWPERVNREPPPKHGCFVRLQVKKPSPILAEPKITKKFFGPVDINKIKIDVSENLNKADWSMHLEALSVYQW